MKKNKLIKLREQQMLELEILKEFRRICDKYELKYFLVGGTLIGAVRHKGFIPWDDDIDVSMLRKDYDKLIEVYHKEEIGNTKLLNFENNREFYLGYVKIVNTDTRLSEEGFKPVEEVGVFIDIFPIDNVLDDKEKQANMIKSIQKYKSLLYLVQADTLPKCGKVKYVLKKLIRWYLSTFGYNFILKRMDKIARQYNHLETQYTISAFGAYGMKEVIDRNFFSKTTNVLFEGEKFNCTKDYDEYLNLMYGDYMKLPPKEKQKPPHCTKVEWK